MKKLIFSLMFMVMMSSVFAADNVIITEVLYDPAGTDSGGEAVQLFNPTASPVDISGWVLKTKTSIADATIPTGTILQPNSYYLIADAGWAANKDNPSWPDADYEEAITLANTDAGIALINNRTIVDAVGWGSELVIPAGLFEGTPALEVAGGKSLQRIQANNEYADSNNNLNDFIEGTPSFQTNKTSSSVLTIEAIITGAAPVIESVEIMDEDETTEGIQISPVPKQNKTINVKMRVSDSDGWEDFMEVKIRMGGEDHRIIKVNLVDSTTVSIETNITLPYYHPEGKYAIGINVTDRSGFSAEETITFEYLGLVAVELDTNHIVLSANPGTITEITGDNDMSTADKPTIRNIGNKQVDVEVSGTNLAAEQNTLAATSVLYSFGNGFSNLTTTNKIENTNLAAGINSKLPLSLRLNVPLGTRPGTYFGSINIAGVAS